MKQCNACKKNKELSEFNKNKSSKDGLLGQCKKCNSERVKKHYHRKITPEILEANRTRRYSRHGITKEIFDAKLAEQGGGCAICGTILDTMVVDHDHSHCSGTWGCSECFRGVLCPSHNRGLGIFDDNVEFLKKAIAYLDV